MPRTPRHFPLWRLLIVVLFVSNLAGWAAVLSWVSFSVGTPGQPPWIRYMWDGRVLSYYPLQPSGIAYRFDGRALRPIAGSPPFWSVHSPPSLRGALAVWWPVAVSGGLSVFLLAAACVPVLRLRMKQRVGAPRITISGGLVVIGVFAYWFWLRGMNDYWMQRGIPVMLLTLVAGYRLRRLAPRVNAGPATASGLMRVVAAGYLVAMLLAAAWLVSALVWKNVTSGRQ
jgi:hypothetical protein